MVDKAREEMSALMDGEATELELHRVLTCSENDAELRASWRRYHLVRSVMQGDARDKQVLKSATMDISAAVSEAIHDEPRYHQKSSEIDSDTNAENKSPFPWLDKVLRPLGSVAVAASVSFMVVLGWQSTGGFQNQPMTSSVATVAQTDAYQSQGQATNQRPINAPLTRSMPTDSAYSSVRFPVSNGASSGYILADDSGRSVSRGGGLNSQEVIRLKVPARDVRFNRYILSHSGNAAFNTASGAIPYARVMTLQPSRQNAK